MRLEMKRKAFDRVEMQRLAAMREPERLNVFSACSLNRLRSHMLCCAEGACRPVCGRDALISAPDRHSHPWWNLARARYARTTIQEAINLAYSRLCGSRRRGSLGGGEPGLHSSSCQVVPHSGQRGCGKPVRS